MKTDIENKVKDLENRSRTIARSLMSLFFGLRDFECVHHINGKPFDNRVENLLIVTKKDHRAIHVKMGGVKEFNKPKKVTFESVESLIHLFNEGIWIDCLNTNCRPNEIKKIKT